MSVLGLSCASMRFRKIVRGVKCPRFLLSPCGVRMSTKIEIPVVGLPRSDANCDVTSTMLAGISMVIGGDVRTDVER